ncbi:MAG: hypothetical protein WBF81_01885 [Thermoplasmata archaeon]
MSSLENPPENPCFGCGPQHPRGLKLRFDRTRAADGVEELRTSFVPQPDEVGWPGLFHTGLHFTVLYEVSYWTALTLGGRLMVSTGPGTYEHRRLPRVGQPHVARARFGPSTGDLRTVRATTASAEGRPCGTLETTWRTVGRAEIERGGLRLPEYLLAEIPE